MSVAFAVQMKGLGLISEVLRLSSLPDVVFVAGVEGISGSDSSTPMSAGSGEQTPLPAFHFSIGPIDPHALKNSCNKLPRSGLHILSFQLSLGFGNARAGQRFL